MTVVKWWKGLFYYVTRGWFVLKSDIFEMETSAEVWTKNTSGGLVGVGSY